MTKFHQVLVYKTLNTTYTDERGSSQSVRYARMPLVLKLVWYHLELLALDSSLEHWIIQKDMVKTGPPNGEREGSSAYAQLQRRCHISLWYSTRTRHYLSYISILGHRWRANQVRYVQSNVYSTVFCKIGEIHRVTRKFRNARTVFEFVNLRHNIMFKTICVYVYICYFRTTEV